jgi:geranylgeranyl diphosphate synthase type I
MMERINIITAHIHQGLLSWIPPHSPDLAEVIDDWFLQNRVPEIVIVAGTCKASGGNPEDPRSLRVMTALLTAMISMEILNDYERKNNPHALWLKVGAERAMHYSHMLQVLFGQLCSQVEEDAVIDKSILHRFQQSLLVVLASRNRMRIKEVPTWEGYWKYTRMATGYFTGTLAAAGAELVAEPQSHITESCRNFGYHLGIARHIISELLHFTELSLQFTGSRNISLGVLYGLQCEHPDQSELKQIVWQNNLDLQKKRVKEILDGINTRDYLIWAALTEKNKALECIGRCPDENGKKFLEILLTEYFNRVSVFENVDTIYIKQDRKVEIPKVEVDINSGFSGTLSLAYQSIGLGIRKNIRDQPLQLNY